MKYFGTVKSFDDDRGVGSLKPETGGDDLSFERSAIKFDRPSVPTVGQRLSYDKGMVDSQPCAVNLARI
jgi:CspA family cold shock protein